MGGISWIIIAVAVMIIVLGIAAFVASKKGKKRPIDYYVWFWIGIIWIAIGFPLENYALSIMGIVFAGVGYSHRKEWKKNRQSWKQLPSNKRKSILISIILGVLVLAAGIIFYYFYH